MNDVSIRRTAAGLAVAAAAIHLALVGEYFEEAAYLGVLFVVGSVALIVSAVRLWRADDRPAWLVGAAVSAGMLVGFVLSRTLGLPGFKEEEWELSGLVSMMVEAGFLGCAAYALRTAKAPRQLATR